MDRAVLWRVQSLLLPFSTFWFSFDHGEGELCPNLVSPGRLTSNDIFKAPVEWSWIIKLQHPLPSLPFSCPHHSANKSFLDSTRVPAPQGRGSDSSLAVPQTAERGESRISCAGAAGWSRGDADEHVVAWWCVRALSGKGSLMG